MLLFDSASFFGVGVRAKDKSTGREQGQRGVRTAIQLEERKNDLPDGVS
jgi:hypothetical protein